jgi:hypothetical protein
MIVGLDVNSGGSPITAYQAYAADVDGNGKVELSDAISVLMRIVGLETMKADWMFFNKANGAPVISGKLSPGLPPSPSAFVNNPTSPNVNIFAVLRGDVIANSQYTYYWTLTSSPANSTAPTIGASTSPAFYATTTGKYEAVVTIMDENFNSSQTTTTMVVCNSASNTSSPFSSCDNAFYEPISSTSKRIIAFGDALVDVGQTGRVDANNNNTPYRYTVNQDRGGSTLPNTGTTFIDAIASYFGFASVSYALDNLTSGRLPSTGAYSYGEFGALVSGAANFGAGTAEPTDGTLQVADARGCQKVAASKATRTAGAAVNAYCAYSLQAQIDLFLAQGAPTSNDLFVISIGTGDIMATGIRGMGISTLTPYVGLDDIQTLLGGPLTSTAAINLRMQTAANTLAVQVKRLTDAGAKYVLVVGPPNVGRSPWAAESGYATLLQNLSYNTGSGVISMGSEGLARIQATFGNQANNPVLFVEISGLVNTLTDGTNATFANKATPACASTANTSTSVNAKSIGTGLKPVTSVGSVPSGRLSAAFCTTATLNGDPSSYVYADGVNFTPAMQSQIYNQALSRMRLAAWIN